MAQLMYGKNVVKQILNDAKKVHKVYLAIHDREIESLCQKYRIYVEYVDKRLLQKMTRTDCHQGVAIEIDDYQTYSVDEIMKHKKGKYGLIVLLDGLEDPHNLGAILRTVDAVGADGVIFKKNNSVGLTPTVAKVSAGAIDSVKCAQVTNLVRTIELLKQNGYWIVGTAMNGQDYRMVNYDFNTVLVIGNEGKGISRLVKENCDYIVRLPMRGAVQSLNASVSTGILLYQIATTHFPLK